MSILRYRFSLLRASAFCIILVLLSSVAISVRAETRTITFGPTLQYNPAQMQVNVGDVIVWQGDFSQHPLAFDNVPTGALMPSDVTSGTTFSYTVEVAGVYNYHCNIHHGLGMVGTFTAGQSSGVKSDVSSNELRVFPTISTGVLRIDGDVAGLRLTNVNGTIDFIIVESGDAGNRTERTVDLRSLKLAPGAYFIYGRVEGVQRRAKVLLR